jgi:hypothetical protein
LTFLRNNAHKHTIHAGAKNKRIRKYYEKQNSYVKELLDVHSWTEVSKKKRSNSIDEESLLKSNKKDSDHKPRAAEYAVNASFNANIFLFMLKCVAFALSGSLSVLASLLDSFLDLSSGLILFFSMRAMGNASNDSFRFPVGKNRLEPLGVMLFAVVMGISMLMLARETITHLIVGFTSDDGGSTPTFGPEVLAGIVSTVVIKAALYVYCNRVVRNFPSLLSIHLFRILTNTCILNSHIHTQHTHRLKKRAPPQWKRMPKIIVTIS